MQMGTLGNGPQIAVLHFGIYGAPRERISNAGGEHEVGVAVVNGECHACQGVEGWQGG